jgi:hypothetical protein
MFQYTREFIINEDLASEEKYGKNVTTTDGRKFAFIGNIATYEVGNDSHGLPRIFDYYEQDYIADVAPEVEVSFTANSATIHKLEVRIKLHRDAEASYTNPLKMDMEKLFQFEIPAGYSLVKAVELINKALCTYEGMYFKAEESGAKIKLIGSSARQRIHAVMYTVDDINAKSELSLTKISDVTKQGEIGMGSYEFLLYNNRLPVLENMAWNSVNAANMPWPGKTYRMIEFKYNSGIRNIGGSSVVGSYERTVTTHRFWVATDVWAKADSKIKAALTFIKNNGAASAAEAQVSEPAEIKE